MEKEYNNDTINNGDSHEKSLCCAVVIVINVIITSARSGGFFSPDGRCRCHRRQMKCDSAES